MQNTETPKRDVYTIVTDRIISLLEKGTIPWKKPWTGAGLPQNLITKRPYRGINVLLLASLDYSRNYFLSYKQVKELGGFIKKDEKPHIVVYWNWTQENNNGEEGEAKKRPFLRYYMVYNVDQCTGISESLIPQILRPASPIPACEAILQNMPRPPLIRHKEVRAFYNPLLDIVNMPKNETFQSNESYYSTLFHELIHSTGHLSRLNRKGLLEMSEFGSEPYSFEELIAEMGAAYLESHAGIVDVRIEQNASYIKSWLEKFKGDKRFVISASSQAQKATDFILNLPNEESEPVEEKDEVHN